jgi:hypothetical protein
MEVNAAEIQTNCRRSDQYYLCICNAQHTIPRFSVSDPPLKHPIIVFCQHVSLHDNVSVEGWTC